VVLRLHKLLIESTLNVEISREESRISAQQKNLTTELNRANQILQAIPSMLNQVNAIYSASTGYHNNSNG
jgi:flagellar hook-associated protein 2